MTTFIHDVLKDLQEKNLNISNLIFVLPSKRAGIFLKHQLSEVVHKTIFAPQILSIEEFVSQLSQIKTISNTELLFEFYSIYEKLTEKENLDSFESFSKWAQILIQDFNEVDRYLIPQKNIFDYLSAIQDVNHWSAEKERTQFIKKYLAFWNKLYNYYNHFTKHLLNNNVGYQGLVYREAVANLPSYLNSDLNKKHIFVGFNALNTAEETIIQALLENAKAEIYWDIDEVFMNNVKHDAALFTRQHLKNWNYFKTNPFNWITSNYSKNKNISTIGIPKNIGQAKYIGSLLNDLKKNNNSLNSTAVVLGDENLLIPVLNSLPKSINALNITMGLPLKTIPLASLFDSLFQLHKTNSKSFYFKDVVKIISHQFIRSLLHQNGVDNATKIIETIDKNNLVFLTITSLTKIAKDCEPILNILFDSWQNSPIIALENCSKLILEIKTHLDENKTTNLLPLEYAFRFNKLFNELTRLNNEHRHIKDVSVLYSIYKELLSSETLDFQGEPLQGLQLMGMLESRVLDFETVIISSVNEGILPAGKSNNSFIPFDVKLENNLPTYKEKDAVYTYHFYRLIQRAKNVYIIYNTEQDVLTGGEKSRFITQLNFEKIHQINHQIVTPQIPIIEENLNVIQKTESLQEQLINLASAGFSPSSLTSYIRNPIDFYYQKILKIKDHDDVEETVAANTLGTVVHNTLEDFYKPLVGQFLTLQGIKNLKSNIEQRVTHHFKQEYKEGDITKGKNLIIFEIAKRYVSNFINLEIKALKAGDQIKIIAIESNNDIEIKITEINFPVRIRGKVDRVDQCNGTTRIIDYKTGKVEQYHVNITNWEDISTDYKKFSKSFQVLTYAYMMHHENKIQLPVEAGIISFKNLKSGFIKFSKKEGTSKANTNSLVTLETLQAFEIELKKLIIEICNPNIDFIEKEV